VKVLGIETSCDDTSAAVLDDRAILSNVVSSQDDVHAAYGGVVPELAARSHLESVQPVIRKAMADAGVEFGDLDSIAVTSGPGLVGSLLVGVSVAQGLALRSGRPLVGVNHLEGHVLSPLIGEKAVELETPFLALLVSGGHTALYRVRDIGDYAEIASTRDDSAGEAFDKGAKMLGLGYPGGRIIDELARDGDVAYYRFPRARVRGDALALSFSGLKTSLWDFLRAHPDARIEDVCASFQEAIVDVLVKRVGQAVEKLSIRRVVVAGGVSANSRLRAEMTRAADALGARLVLPPMKLCTDNGAMIAGAAMMRRERSLDDWGLDAASRMPLGPRLRLK